MTPSSSTYADRWTTLAAVVFALSWLLPNHHGENWGQITISGRDLA